MWETLTASCEFFWSVSGFFFFAFFWRCGPVARTEECACAWCLRSSDSCKTQNRDAPPLRRRSSFLEESVSFSVNQKPGARNRSNRRGNRAEVMGGWVLGTSQCWEGRGAQTHESDGVSEHHTDPATCRFQQLASLKFANCHAEIRWFINNVTATPAGSFLKRKAARLHHPREPQLMKGCKFLSRPAPSAISGG